MRAISVLSLETGTSTRWCLAAAALRRRVKKSAMGSVCMILLPAGFHHARDFPAQRHAAKTDAAHLKLADIAARSAADAAAVADRKSTRLNSSHLGISYAVFCLKKKKKKNIKLI